MLFLFFFFFFFRPKRKSSQPFQNKTKSKPKQRNQCLLDAMLQARDVESGLSMTDAQLRDELLTMLIAG